MELPQDMTNARSMLQSMEVIHCAIQRMYEALHGEPSSDEEGRIYISMGAEALEELITINQIRLADLQRKFESWRARQERQEVPLGMVPPTHLHHPNPTLATFGNPCVDFVSELDEDFFPSRSMRLAK